MGDTLFMPDYGTARCDFPKGSAATLFDSVKKLYQLDGNMRIFLCHDYLPESRLKYNGQSSLQTQKSSHIHINVQTIKAKLVEMQNRRDTTLSMPKIILLAIQINMDGADFLNLKQTEFVI